MRLPVTHLRLQNISPSGHDNYVAPAATVGPRVDERRRGVPMSRGEPDEVNGHYLERRSTVAARLRDAWGAIVGLRAAGIVAVVVPLVLIIVLVVLSLTGRIQFGE